MTRCAATSGNNFRVEVMGCRFESVQAHQAMLPILVLGKPTATHAANVKPSDTAPHIE
jgi:hypothetical protein